jgi:hypothetical protein
MKRRALCRPARNGIDHYTFPDVFFMLYEFDTEQNDLRRRKRIVVITL